jgi:hypothetical protein
MTDIFISPAEDMYVNSTIQVYFTVLTPSQYSYIVTDCIRTDLHRLIQSTSKKLEDKFIQFFTYQMLVRLLKFVYHLA